MNTLPTRMILNLILGMLVLPVFPQDEPPPNIENTSELSDDIVDLMTKAEQGGASAQFNLGFRHELGLLNVPQDYTQAARWYGAAAEQGDVKAQFSLGFLYYEGLGCLRIIPKQRGGIRQQPSRDITMHSSTLVSCMPTDWACLRITRKLCGGIREQPNTEMQMHRTTLVSCMKTDGEYLRTTFKHLCGTASPLQTGQMRTEKRLSQIEIR